MTMLTTTMPATAIPITLTTAHQQVELALRPRVMQGYLARFNPSDQGHTPTACHVLDAKYEPGKQCSVLYQLGSQLMIGELRWSGKAQPLGARPGREQAPEMQVYPFERDPALPGLTTVLDGSCLSEVLSRTLPECVAGSVRILRCQVTPLRYRLGKRCTLRFDLRLRDAKTGQISARTLYGKLYHTADKAQAVYNEMQMLSAAPVLQAQGVTVAQAVAFVPELPLVLQAPVNGAPLDLWLCQPKGGDQPDHPALGEGIRQAADALAALHQVEVCTRRVRSVAAELERFQERSKRIMAVDPTVGGALFELARALTAWLPQLPDWGAEQTLVHGDCKPSQFFVTAPQAGDDQAAAVALLDFDHCGVADPAADVGNFLASLRQLAVGQRLKQRDPDTNRETSSRLAALEEEFLTAYVAARSCHLHFHQRATWYQAVALLRKALRAYARSTRSPLPARLVQEAWRCLATLPAA